MTDKTPAAPADQTNETAATEETTMTDEKTGAAEAQTHAADTRSHPGPSNQRSASAKPEVPDTEAVATRAREAERDRVSTIYDLAGRLNLERSFAEDLVKRGVGVDAVVPAPADQGHRQRGEQAVVDAAAERVRHRRQQRVGHVG